MYYYSVVLKDFEGGGGGEGAILSCNYAASGFLDHNALITVYSAMYFSEWGSTWVKWLM
jgi:hypothetical protein